MTIEQVVRDVRYGCRGLVRDRGFTATTVGTLSVGLALVTVVFTIFNAYVLRPFAVRDPYSLHALVWWSGGEGGRTFRWHEYQELRGRTDLFDGVVAERTRFVSCESGRAAASFVSGNYFDTVGARVLLGRALAEFDARIPGSERVVVLTDQGWTRLFDRDPGVLGRSLTLNGEPFAVIGVMREAFSGLDDSPRDLWLPITMYPTVMKQDLFGPAQPRDVAVTVRLRQGLAAGQAQSALTTFVARLSGKSEGARAELRPQATPAPLTLHLIAILSPVFVAFGLVLLASCANVSNIMLARGNARHREIGIRLSLGASRGRVVRQLLTEGALVTAAAGALAFALAALVLRAGTVLLFVMLPPTGAALVRVVPLEFDYRVFLFALLVGSAATIVFALVPALQATRLTLTHALRGEVTGTFRGSTLRNLLIVSQVTVSLVLLIASFTLVRNGVKVQATDIGLDTRGVYTVNQRARGESMVARAVTTLTSDPRIGGVAVTSRNPLSGQLPKTPAAPAGRADITGASYMFVSPEYFDMVGVTIIRGRGFLTDEARSEAAVAVISRAAAAAFWPGMDPLGRTIRIQLERPGPRAEEIFGLKDLRRETADMSGGREVTVVGIANDVVSGFVFDGTDTAHIYLPTGPTGSRAAALLVRGHSRNDLRLIGVQSALQAVHPDPLAFEAMPLEESLALQMFPLRVASWIGSLLSAIALTLSVSGLYGMVSYGLSQRKREIGIRMALGATAGAIVRLVMAQSARLAAIGASVGLLMSFTVLAALGAVVPLKNVAIVDPGAFGSAIVIIGAAATLAAFVPARRAAGVDPAHTLRADG